jgi:tagatose 1,6-diphosphate aldolase
VSDLTTSLAIEMIRATANRLDASAGELSRLDAVAGDGDHGANMRAAFNDAHARLDAEALGNAGDVFAAVGESFRENAGGSAGALFGALFGALGGRLRQSGTPQARDVADGLDLAAKRVAVVGRTAAGSKTMLDALEPAVIAAQQAVDDGHGLVDVLTAAALGSQRGAAATADMRATAGRARHAPDGAIGTRDPGAVTVSIILAAWAEVAALGVRVPGATGPNAAAVGGHRVGTVAAQRDRTGGGGRLDRLATPSGQFAILALDHVRSFATTVRPEDPDSLSADEILESKEGLVRALAADASAVLIDPLLASRQLESALAPVTAGVLIGIEDGDYESAVASPRLLPGWSVERAARLGADGIKISVYFDPDEDMTVPVGFVRDVVRQCEDFHLPLFCEPLVRRRPGTDFAQQVLEGIRRFGDLGADVLKIQFPCDTENEQSRARWADACAAADELSPTPWALLSEGRDFDEFSELLAIACRAGASGFLAGRVIWGGVPGDGAGIRSAAVRLSKLRSIAVAEGSPWSDRRQAGSGGHTGVTPGHAAAGAFGGGGEAS